MTTLVWWVLPRWDQFWRKLGLPHAIYVTTAEVTDRAGALTMFGRHQEALLISQKLRRR